MADVLDVGGVRAKITADISGYRDAIDKAKVKTAELGAAGKKAAADVEQIGNVKAKIGQLTPVLDNINAQIEVQRKKLAELRRAYSETFDDGKKSALESKIVSAEAALLRLEKRSDETAKSIWDLEDKLEALGKTADISSKDFTDLSATLKGMGVNSKEITNLERSLRAVNPQVLQREIAEVTAEMKRLGASDEDIAKITDEIEKSAKGASGLSKEMKTLGAAYVGLAVAMGAVISKAVESSRTFEQSMANVRAISQATGAEFEALRKQALSLGATTIYTASQSADAQALLAQAGFKTNDIIAAMPGLLNLAAAGQTDLALTADIAASALNGFRLSADQAGHVADVLAKSSIDTNADVKDLGMAMKYVAPVAASMGISIEEATAAVGELSNAGIKGEMAGTQLRAMLLALASPSEEAARYMELLGVNLSDASGQILPLSDLVGQLQSSFTRLTQAQQADVAATLVGREAASGFLTLISQGKTTLDNYTASLQNSGGTAEQVAETQMDTLNGAIQEMESALEGVGITVGDMFAPAIRQVAETITSALVAFDGLNPALQAAIVAFPTAAAAVGGLVVGIYALRASLIALQVSFPILGAISLVIGAVVAGVAALVSHSNAAAESVKKHDEAQKSLNDTLNQSPVNRTVAELEDLQTKTDELNTVLEERAELQGRLNTIEALQAQSLGTPQLLSEALDIGDAIREVDKRLRELGHDDVDAATDSLRKMREEIEKSTPALFALRKEEINDLAAKKQTIDAAEKLVATYKELNAKQELDTQQKQELVSTVNALRKEYPDLNAKMDEEGRLRADNIGLVEKQIDADRAFMSQAVETQKVYVQNLISTTETQRKSVEAQITNYTKLLSVMQAINGAKLTDKGPQKTGVGDALKVANPQLARYTEQFAETKYDETKAELSGLYAKQNRLREAEIEMKRSLNSLTSGDFASSGITNGIDLTKPEKASKSKSGKTAAELAADARKKLYDADLATIRYQADMFDWSADKQIEAYEKLRKNHVKYLQESVDDRRTLDLQIKRLNEDSIKAQYDFSAEWIKREERRMEESGKSEAEITQMKLAAWTRVRDRYAKDSEFYKQADEQVYQLRKSLVQQTTKLTDDLVKTEKTRINDVKKAEIEAIKARKKAALDDYDARIKAIDELMAKEDEYNSDVDYATALREKNARIDELASAVGPEGIAEREQAIKERDRMILEHERELRKRELESQKDALEDEKDAQSDAFDREISATEAQYDALIDAFNSYSGDIKTIEAVLASFRVSSAAQANSQILTELDAFVREYNAKMSQVSTLSTDSDLAEYNANKDAWDAAKARGDSAEMARLAARNQAIRDQYGITTDTGRLQSFHGGGVVQGPRGAETVVLAKAGELVLTEQQQAVLFDALSGIGARPVTNPPAGPTQIVNHYDLGVDELTLGDDTDVRTFYDERARFIQRQQTQGVKALNG